MIQNIKSVKFLSDKYKVTVVEKTKESADVCIALLADGCRVRQLYCTVFALL